MGNRQSMGSWVEALLSSPKGRYFVEVDADFLRKASENFRPLFVNFSQVLDFMMMQRAPRSADDGLGAQATKLYGLIHAQYLCTNRGLSKMHSKYLMQNAFPLCPRRLCIRSLCLPYGASEIPDVSKAAIFCPQCSDVYISSDAELSSLDGAFFGPNWVHIFIRRFSDIISPAPPKQYIPRIFGFRFLQEDKG